MASSPQGEQLTEQHRLEQLAIAAAALRELLPLWPLLDPMRLDDTAPGWINAVMRVIAQFRQMSAERATGYYQQFKTTEIGAESLPETVVVPEMNLTQVRTSLTVTGPVQEKQLIAKGRTPEQASTTALVTSSKAVQRHVLNAGREVLKEKVRSDADAVGWARVTDGDPCYFCALLASRGFVYKDRETALKASGKRGNRSLGQSYHDGCGCTAEPAFEISQEPPGKAQEWDRLYAESTSGTSGKESLRAFRRAYEASRPGGGPV